MPKAAITQTSPVLFGVERSLGRVFSQSRVMSELVDPADVVRAQTDLSDESRIAVEPAAAVALAGVRALSAADVRGKRIAVFLCGSNLGPAGIVKTESGAGIVGGASSARAKAFSDFRRGLARLNPTTRSDKQSQLCTESHE